MKKLLNSKWPVVALVLMAFASIIQSVALPLIDSDASKDLVEDIVDPLLSSLNSSTDTVEYHSNIDLSNLDWVDQPRRNPFQAEPKPIEISTKKISAGPTAEKKIEAEVAIVAPQLEAIVINDTTRYAVLDSEIISSGERLGAFKLNSINADHVVLSGPGGKLRLHLNDLTSE